MRGREGGDSSAPSRGHRQQLTKPSASWIVRMSSPMQDCAAFIPLMSSRRSWERAMAWERGVAGVSLRGESLALGPLPYCSLHGAEGQRRGHCGQRLPFFASSTAKKGQQLPRDPHPCPGGAHCTTRVSRDGSSPACSRQSLCKTTEADPKGKELLPPPQSQPGPGRAVATAANEAGVIKQGPAPRRASAPCSAAQGNPPCCLLPECPSPGRVWPCSTEGGSFLESELISSHWGCSGKARPQEAQCRAG